MRLRNKVALITGGGSGIGRATAELFAREGAAIVVSDVSESGALEVANQLGAEGLRAEAFAGDVSISRDAEAMVQSAVEAYARLDVLVNSAGVSARNALSPHSQPEEVWDRVIDVNLKGTYLASFYAVPEMERSEGGSIINLASIMGLVGYGVGLGGGFNPYPPSKGGVIQLTRNMAVDCARKNIRVNCICPGYVETDLTRSLTEELSIREELEGRHPVGRLGRPEEIAYAALFLASDEASFVTGAPLIVDGGYTAQ